MIPPGSTIGILGGGQLGRMSALAGRRMGYRFHIYDPSPEACAQSVADVFVNAPYEDEQALAAFAQEVDVVTVEFENIPVETLQQLEWTLPVRPDSRVLGVCQNREAEKKFLAENGFPCADFKLVDSYGVLEKAFEMIGAPSVLKTAAFGYDGKGQFKINGQEDLQVAWDALGGERAVLEKWIPFEAEYSIVCARNRQGETRAFPISENIHTNHILDISIAPARLDTSALASASDLVCSIMEELGVVGLLAVELFRTKDGKWLVNEMAPRPHNSGHYTFDACLTSQFEQHIRAVCDLPLGATDLLRPVAMVNILGDAWHAGRSPDWEGLLRERNVKLHLYDKGEPRKGRKMGHFCVFGESSDAVFERACALRERFLQPTQ